MPPHSTLRKKGFAITHCAHVTWPCCDREGASPTESESRGLEASHCASSLVCGVASKGYHPRVRGARRLSEPTAAGGRVERPVAPIEK
jgi:hypothetical protein